MQQLQSTKVIIINVLITFVEGFAAAWLVMGNSLSKHALVGAAAAGASLAWNTAIKPLLKYNGILYKKV